MNIIELKARINHLPDAMPVVLANMDMDEEHCILNLDNTDIGVEEIVKNDAEEELVEAFVIRINN